MLVALLAVLGVNLLLVLGLLAAVLGRRHRIARRPGAFRAAARVVQGEGGHPAGLHRHWRAGYGRWVQDVFIWTSSPLLLRTTLVPVDAVSAVRPLGPKEVRRPRGLAGAVTLTAPRAVLEVAVRDRDEALAQRLPAADPTGTTRSPRGHL
ncbi:hypothetical protein I3F58_14980 [Streptomyces sp. MUM 203J]|uniref:hypothetical protein n=1 Tax=Streptomyces sp. MUM 203J TaxID=2791990 RepID=UPI001F04D61D|nr:hypothetical protein [Streptomyces sp. MUM 203J]MCH0540851.1 hypothetical protein [Streptomyces sp. MUM 203J]